MIFINKIWRFLQISLAGVPVVQEEIHPKLDIMPQASGAGNP